MATGYTSMLEELNYDVPRWLKERVIRAMGVCVTLRDDSMDLTGKQIKSRLEKFEDKDDYHERALKEAKRSLKEAMDKTKPEFKAEYDKKKAAAQKRFDKDLIEFDKKKAEHLKALEEVNKLMAKAEKAKPGEEREMAIGTLKFAKSQLEQTIDFDYSRSEPYKDEILDLGFAEWMEQRLLQPKRDIDYHTKEIEKKKERFKENRADLYEAFVKFIDRETNV